MGLILWFVAELVGEVVRHVTRWIFAPAWHALVRQLDVPAVLLLWGATGAVMYVAWRLDAMVGSAAAWVPIALFLLTPVLAIAATGAWRDRHHPPARRRRSAY